MIDTLIAQVSVPSDGTNAWMWVSVLMAGALASVSLKLFNVLVKDRDEWKAQAKDLTTALTLTTDTLKKATEVVEQSRADGVELGKVMRDGIARLEENIDLLVKRSS